MCQALGNREENHRQQSECECIIGKKTKVPKMTSKLFYTDVLYIMDRSFCMFGDFLFWLFCFILSAKSILNRKSMKNTNKRIIHECTKSNVECLM